MDSYVSHVSNNADALPSLVVAESIETAMLALPLLYEAGVELHVDVTPGIYDARSTFENYTD